MDLPPLLPDLPERLVGSRVVVRPYRMGDGLALYEAVAESQEHILPWLPWGPGHESPRRSEELVRHFREVWEARTDLPLGIWSEDGRFLGGTGLHRFDLRIGSFEIGYWIRKSEEGKGYVTEAVKLLADLVFQDLRGNRLTIRCAVGNRRSSAIPQRLGFTFEGVARNSAMNAYGKLQHMETYSLIPEEYERLRPTW